MTQKIGKQINQPDDSVSIENPQLDVVVGPELKPSNSTRKRKIFPDDSTRIVLRLKKKLFPNLELSSNASVEIDNFVKDYMESFQFSLRNLTRYKRPKTLTIRELECATRLVLPPDLAQRAVVAGEKAMLKAKSSCSGEISRPSDVFIETLKIPSTCVKAPLMRKKKSIASYSINLGTYILRLKKLLQPDLQLSKESLEILNSFLTDIISQFQLCLRNLPRIRKYRTLSIHDLQCATKLCLPSVLGECAKEYGMKAVNTAQQPKKRNNFELHEGFQTAN